MATKKPNRYLDMRGVEYNYDYFVKCFATFGTLVSKANKIIPGGIEEEFIKHLLKEKIYSQGGWMIKPDGSKFKLYYPIILYRLLLVRDNSGIFLKDSQGNYIWKPNAKAYYDKWKSENEARNKGEEERKHQRFLNNISRYDPDLNKE